MKNMTHTELVELVKYYKLDDLTGLMQRKDLFEFVTKKIKANSFFCLSMVDVDNLHMVNRRDGMKAGDNLIKSVSNSLISIFGLESVYRYGGDEFIIVHNIENVDGLLSNMDNITFATVPFIGIHTTFSEIFKEVDKALIKDKCKKPSGNCVYRGHFCAKE